MSELLPESAMRAHVVICQKRLVHYRVEFFERLRGRLAREGVRLSLVLGSATGDEASRRDSAELDWAQLVPLRFFFGGRAYWQPLPSALRKADLVVVTQENKILSNYALQVLRLFTRRRLAFWGHGRNYQGEGPHAWRERWKRFWIRQVDWWFAYTAMSAREVAARGYPPQRITVLNNAIDGDGFRADLAAVGPAELAGFRQQRGIEAAAPVAVYCGSLYADKRLDFLIAAGDAICGIDPRFKLFVLGAGPEEPKLRQAAASRPWLCMLGMRKGVEKALVFRCAQLMLNPGLVGLHVIDSFVSGCPLVTLKSSQHSPEVEYLQDGRDSVWIGSDEPGQYASAVLALFNDPSRLAAMRAACEAGARLYTLDAMVENFAAGALAALAAPAR